MYISTYFYIFIHISSYIYLYLPIFMHITNYFHVYLYLYLTYLDIFSCIFIPIFMYISTYFYIFLLISTYLVLFSTCRALQLLLPASARSCLRYYLPRPNSLLYSSIEILWRLKSEPLCRNTNKAAH